MFRRFSQPFGLVACLVLAAPLAVQADELLPQDPNNVYGRLDNGFSYIIREHKNPPDRIALFLHIKSGALNETEKQNGLAHFLEHMSFNGSKNFAPGELIPYMSKMGMRFGADSNAHTSYEETVYKLFMPDITEETIDKAFTILHDYADGLLLLEKEIDNERKVILEEARARKSAMERIQKQTMKKLFENTRIAIHDVIGDEKQIAEFPREEFVDYWNTWYRPENMTLIIVGDIKADRMASEIRRRFADFKPRGTARTPPGAGLKPVEKSRAFVLTDPEQVMCQMQMVAIKSGRPAMKSFEDYRFNELENMGTWIVSRRLREMVDKGDAAFRMAGVSVSDLFREAILPSGMAIGEPGDWNRMLEQVIVEISRAIEHGFTDRELELARQEVISNAEQRVEREPTMDANRLINRISRDVGQDEPMLSAPQHLELTRRVLSEVTAKDVHRVFVENYKNNAFTYVLAMPEKKEGFEPPSDRDVLAAAAEAWARKTTAPKKTETVENLLAEKPAPGKIKSKTTDEDLGITTATLSNGVVVHHRYMDYKKDEVLVQIVLPGGSIEETAENRGISEAAEVALNRPATSRLDSSRMSDLMTGRKVQFGGNIGTDTLTISFTASPSDYEFGMELAYALLTDGKVEDAAFDNWRRLRLQRLEMMNTAVQGQLRKAMDEVFFAGDVRLCELTAGQIDRLSAAQAQKWLRRITGKAAIEAVIIGDIKLEPAMEIACQYLGGLPKRTGDFAALDSLRKIKRGSGPYEKTVEYETVTPKAMAMAGYVGCEERDTVDRRLLTMATRIITERMIKRLREEEQLVYSIGCQSQPSRSIPGLGMIYAGAPTDPENAERLADSVLEMLQDFAAEAPTAEEVETAARQLVTSLETNLKEPDFWRSQIAELIYRGRSLSELKELPDVYKRFTVEQVHAVAKKYMTPDRAIRLVVTPLPVTKNEPKKESAEPAAQAK